jgi:hypothetical protein
MALALPALPTRPLRADRERPGGAERRRSTTIALLRSDPRLSRTPRVSISICLLEDLQAKGPFAPIFRDVRDPERAVSWLGDT